MPSEDRGDHGPIMVTTGRPERSMASNLILPKPCVSKSRTTRVDHEVPQVQYAIQAAMPSDKIPPDRPCQYACTGFLLALHTTCMTVQSSTCPHFPDLHQQLAASRLHLVCLPVGRAPAKKAGRSLDSEREFGSEVSADLQAVVSHPTQRGV